MLLSKTTVIKWNSKIKKRYVDLGYIFTKMGDEFQVNISDLTQSSYAKVQVMCDYCNQEYEISWYRYIAGNKTLVQKDCCIHDERWERLTPKYKHWRDSVFQRDLYTCQCCHKKIGKGVFVVLNAHHLCNWNDYIDKRYELDNGITLCEKCHIGFHSRYGKKNNTLEQYKEYISIYGKKVC